MPNTYYENGYALLIGIAYEHWATKIAPLHGTLRDFTDLAAHFADPAKAAYRPAHIICLTETEATAENIWKFPVLLSEYHTFYNTYNFKNT